MYHRLPADRSAAAAMAVPLPEFERQLALIADARYQVVSLRDWLVGRHTPSDRTARTAVLTFDDGYSATCDRAERLLDRYGWTATLFLTSGLVGRRDPLGAAAEGVLEWGQLRSLRRLDVQAHTRTHPQLSTLGRSRLRDEVGGSRREIEDRLGKPVEHFAYPYGAYTRSVVRAVREAGFASACSVHRGLARAGDGRFRLHRVTVDGRDPPDVFARKLRTGYASAGEAAVSRLRDVAYGVPFLHDLVERRIRRQSAGP